MRGKVVALNGLLLGSLIFGLSGCGSSGGEGTAEDQIVPQSGTIGWLPAIPGPGALSAGWLSGSR